MMRSRISVSVLAVVIGALAACSAPAPIGPGSAAPADGMRGRSEPLGKTVTLEEARKVAPYEIALPSYHPVAAEIDSVYLAETADPNRTQVLIRFTDGSFIEFLPSTSATSYDTQASMDGRARIRSVGGASAFVRGSLQDTPGLIKWWRGNLEIVISGTFTAEELVRMAESVKASGA